MYRRYTQIQGENVSISQMKRNRIKNIVILVLVAALVAAAVIAVPMMQRRGEERPLYIERMQAECGETVQYVTSLSRYAGADSAQILAQIRSHLFSIRTLNNMYMLQNKESLIPMEQIDALLKMVDDYLYDLSKGGQNTAVQQTELNGAVEQLKNDLDALN